MSVLPAGEDLYAVLGTARTATPAEIQGAYFRGVRLHPPEKDAEGFRRIHAAYVILKDPKTRKDYDETLRSDPEARTLFDRGRQLLQEEKASEALPLIKRALVRQNDSAVFRDLLTQALIALEQYAEAEKQARRVLAQEPENPTYQMRVGQILRAVDRDAEALPYYRKGVGLDPTNGENVTRLAYLLNYLDKTGEAIKIVEQGIQSDGRVDFDDFIFFQCLYRIYTTNEAYADLERTRQRIRAILPPDPEQRSFVAWFYYHNALVMADRGNFDAAVHSIEEAGAIDSSLPDLARTIQRLRGSKQLRGELEKLGDDPALDVGFRTTLLTVGFRTLLGVSDDLKELLDKAVGVLDQELSTEGCNIAAQIRLVRSRYPALAKELDEILTDLLQADLKTPKPYIRLICPNCGDKTRTQKPTVANLTTSGLSYREATALLQVKGERGILALLTYDCDHCHITYNGLSQRAAPVVTQPQANSGCFVVTATYGDENAYPVRVLRRYRDETLAAHGVGRMLIRIYQVVGPPLARCVTAWPSLREPSRRLCERIARRVDRAS
jgi:tetratricopeptide (TPR) repeat protein